MQIRETGDADIETVATLRLAFLAEYRHVDPTELPESSRVATLAFLQRHSRRGTARTWLAEQDGVPIGLVTMLLLDLAPRPEDASGREGFLINMYVAPTNRRRGLGSLLLGECLRAARELNLRRVVLYATEEGKPLYEASGFEANPSFMELRLS